VEEDLSEVITTIRGVGYRFDAPASERPGPALHHPPSPDLYSRDSCALTAEPDLLCRALRRPAPHAPSDRVSAGRPRRIRRQPE